MAGSEAALEANAAYQTSLFLHDWGLSFGLVFGAFVLFVIFGRSRLISPVIRRWLAFFDHDYRLQIALRFCEMSTLLYRHGITHRELLQEMQRVFSSEPWMCAQLAQAVHLHIAVGYNIDQALSDRVLPAGYAQLLAAMVPQGDTRLYARAYDSLAHVLRAVLRKRYQQLHIFVRTTALLAFVVLFFTLAAGSFNLLTNSINQLT